MSYEQFMEKEELSHLIDDGLSTREISEKTGKSQTTIRYWLKKFDLKTQKKKFNKSERRKCCHCKDDNPDNFYGHKQGLCKTCHNKYQIKKGKEKRELAIKRLGGKCIYCGWDDFSCSLDIHHLDPDKKDANFGSMRGWSMERIYKELEGCVLLCKNHHSAYHAGLIDLPVQKENN